MEQPRVMNRWLVVLGAVLIQLCLGAIYAWSVFTPALKEAGWSTLQTQIVFSVGLATFAIVMVWAGRRLPEWGPRRMAWTGGCVLGLGYVLAGMFGGTNFVGVICFVGIIGGAGIGIGYVVPIAVGMRWFPDKKGLITGLAVAGFGFGAMLWVKLAGTWGLLIQRIGLSGTFIVYGIIFTGLVLVGGIWMVFPPQSWKPKGYVPPEALKDKPAPMGQKDVSVGQMLESNQFYLIFLTFAISAGAGLMSIGLMKLYPMDALTAKGIAEAEASNMAGLAMAVFFSIANGIGRIAWGIISDKIGRKRSIMIMTTTQGFFVIAFTFLAGYEWTLYLGAALIGFNFGGNFALFPTITADTFGTKNVGQNYPYVFLSYGLGGILGPILGGMLGDMQNFPLAFTISGIACIVSAGLISLVVPYIPREKVEPAEIPVAETETVFPPGRFGHRPFRVEDFPSLINLLQSPEKLLHLLPDAHFPLTPEQFQKLTDGRKEQSVILADDQVVGYADFISCEKGGTCILGNLIIDPAFRRHGAEQYLLDHMVEKAGSLHGAKRLQTACFNDQTHELIVYSRSGFTPLDIEEKKDPSGRTMALLHLEKNLTN